MPRSENVVTWKMGLLRVMIDSGGQGQRVIVYNRLYREPQSWPGLSTLRDVCQKFLYDYL